MGQARAKQKAMTVQEQHKLLLLQAASSSMQVVKLEEDIENLQKDLAALKRSQIGALRNLAGFEDQHREELETASEEPDQEIQNVKVPSNGKNPSAEPPAPSPN